MAPRKKANTDDAADAAPDKLKRERAGTYTTADGRFTVEQTSSGWLLLDAEQADELGLPRARGPYATLDEARTVIGRVRTDPTPISDLADRRAARATAKTTDEADEKDDGGGPRKRGRGPAATARGKARARSAARPTAPAVTIRELRTVDGDALRALWKQAGFTSIGDDDKSLGRLARRNPGLVLVATEGTKIVGSALGAWDGRRGWLYHVATAKSHRRQGIATRLVAQVEAGLRDLGCPKVNALVRAENDDGREFWLARGYDAGRARQFGKELDGG